jgi:hypothetical protein
MFGFVFGDSTVGLCELQIIHVGVSLLDTRLSEKRSRTTRESERDAHGCITTNIWSSFESNRQNKRAVDRPSLKRIMELLSRSPTPFCGAAL